MRLALVDVDGTLLDGASCEKMFLRELMAQRRIGLTQIAAASLFAAQTWPRHGRHVFKKNKAYLAGLDVAEIESLAEAFVAEKIVPRLRPILLQRLERHLRSGEAIALLTGAPEFLARPLARAVGAQRWRATECARADRRYIAAPPLAHPFAGAKLRYGLELCAEYGAKIETCVAYADSIHDLPLLTRVGEPVAVHPDGALRRIAERNGWEILLADDEARGRAGTPRRLVASAAPRGARPR